MGDDARAEARDFRPKEEKAGERGETPGFGQDPPAAEWEAKTIAQMGTCAASGDLEGLKKLAGCLSPRAFRRNGGAKIFRRLSSADQLPAAEFLRETFAVSSLDAARFRLLDSFVCVGSEGLVDWALASFAVTDQHLMLAIRAAIRTGHLELARKLGQLLGFPKPRLVDCGWFLLACEQDAKALGWLAGLFPGLLEELRRKCLKVACKAGKLEVVVFLDGWKRFDKSDVLDGGPRTEEKPTSRSASPAAAAAIRDGPCPARLDRLRIAPIPAGEPIVRKRPG